MADICDFEQMRDGSEPARHDRLRLDIAPPREACQEFEIHTPREERNEPNEVYISKTSDSKGAQLGDRTSAGFSEWADNYFTISARGSSVSQECRAGFVTWVTMSYIVVVNPMILSATTPGVDAPISFREGVRATCFSAAVACTFVGFVSNLPFGLAAGMGLNSYVRYNVIGGMGMTAEAALACCFMQGVLFAGLTLGGGANWLQQIIPGDLKAAITAAIGIFQAFVGFQLMGLVVKSEETLVTFGDLNSPELWVAGCAILLIAVLVQRNVKGALLIGIISAAALANLLGIGLRQLDDVVVEPTEKHLGGLDFLGLASAPQEYVMTILCMLFIVIFDTAGVQYGIGHQAGLLDKQGHLPGSMGAFLGSALGTSVGAYLGTSPVIIHNETAAGVKEGGRTGLCGVVTGLLFLMSPMVVPFIELVPPVATAPVLVLVGAFMMTPIRSIDWTDMKVSLPAFLTICVTPLTYSIASGIFTGLSVYFILTGTLRVLDMIWPEQQQSTVEGEQGIPPADLVDEPLDEPLLGTTDTYTPPCELPVQGDHV